MKMKSILSEDKTGILNNGVIYTAFIPEEKENEKIDINIKPTIHQPVSFDKPIQVEGYKQQYVFERPTRTDVTDPTENPITPIVLSTKSGNQPSINGAFNPSETLSRLSNDIKNKEGLRLEAYKDSGGVWTIGYGHTKGVKRGDRITKDEAERLLQEDISSHTDWLVSELPKYKFNENQFSALVDYAYNLGVGSLQNLLKESNGDLKFIGDQLRLRGRTDKAGNSPVGLIKRVEDRYALYNKPV